MQYILLSPKTFSFLIFGISLAESSFGPTKLIPRNITGKRLRDDFHYVVHELFPEKNSTNIQCRKLW